MNHGTSFEVESVPIPAVAAHDGPFLVADTPDGSEYFCDWPRNGNPGVFIVPCDNSNEAFKFRRHGYAYLSLLPDKVISLKLVEQAYEANIHKTWIFSLLSIVADIRLSIDARDKNIKRPVMTEGFAKLIELSKAVLAQRYLRASMFDESVKFREEISELLSVDERALLATALNIATSWAEAGQVVECVFLSLLVELQELFGVPEELKIGVDPNNISKAEFLKALSLADSKALSKLNQQEEDLLRKLNDLFVKRGNFVSEQNQLNQKADELGKSQSSQPDQEGSEELGFLQSKLDALKDLIQDIDGQIKKLTEALNKMNEMRDAALGNSPLKMISPHLAMDMVAEMAEQVLLSGESFDDVKQLFPALSKILRSGDGQWGEMNIDKLPLTESHLSLKRGRDFRPGYVGTLKYPHRALPGADGAAFAIKRRGKGGVMAVDCSRSTKISHEDISRLLDRYPALTIVLYAGNQDHVTGSMVIVARRGKTASSSIIKTWLNERGGFNTIDGPVLKYILKHQRPRIWITDGEVTGVFDRKHANLYLESKFLVKRGDVKIYPNIDSFLSKS